MIPEASWLRRPDDEAHVAWDDGVMQARPLRRPALVAGGLALGTALLAGPIAGTVLAHGPVPAEPPGPAAFLLGWSFEPALVLPLIAVAIAWWRLVGAVDRAHPDHPVPAIRRWSFLAGLLAIAVALQSGIERYDTTLFSVHMVQHLILTLVAPPLLALSAPITQLLRAASPSTRNRWILPVLRSRPIGVIGHPVVAWLALASVMWATHFSPVFNVSLEEPLVHDLEHGLYLAAGLLFWWPVLGLDPAPHRMSHPARILYLFLQMPQNSFLAMAILFADAPLYPHYATLGSPYGIDPLADQRLAAGIMWFVGDVIFLIAMLAVLAGWMRSEQRGAAAAERQADVERGAIREREAAHRARRVAGGLAGGLGGGVASTAATGAVTGGASAGAGSEPAQSGTGEASSSR
jgi:putative membrane protein